MKHRFILTGLIAALLIPQVASAASFNVTGSDSGAKTLNTGDTGTVTATGNLSVSGSGTTVTVSGGTVSINNAGLLRQTGTARTIDANTAGTALTIINSGTISSAGTNETIRIAALSTLNLTNQVGAFITSQAADAIRPGSNSTITNFGTISANPPNVAVPAGSDGIDLRTERTGIVINNYGTVSGRHGIATDGANVGPSSVTVNNYAGTIFALNGSGVNVDANTALPSATSVTANVTNYFGATIKGGVFSAATAGDGDGIDIDGVLTLNNSGDVLGLGAKGANNPEAIAAGGGSITNTSTGQIIGSSLLVDAPNGDTSKLGSGILIDDSNGGNAVAVTTVTNDGLIRGKTGFGIKMIGTFGDTITNNATGTIRGAGASAGAAIQTGGGDDTITNKGAIIGDNGSAIAMEAGNDTLNIQGGAASITGNIDGGTGTNALNVNLGSPANTFSYAGAITNFSTTSVQSGRFNLSGSINSSSAIAITGGTFNYTGAGALGNSITVNGGDLKSNGGNLSGSLTLNSGTVSGTNFSGVALSIGTGVTLSPGNSPGTLLSGSETWAGGGSYLWEINRLLADGGVQGSDPGWDFADITGTLNITANSGNQFQIKIDSLGLLSSWNFNQDYAFEIARASGGIFGFDASDFAFDTSSFTDLHSLGIGGFYVQQDGNSLMLKFSSVPEPATMGFGIALMAVACARRRRRA